MTRPSSVSYVAVTPARDEARYIRDLARSLASQTVPYTRWVIVDDGSTDGTRDIARALAAADPRITLIEREDRAERHAGCGDIVAFNLGMRHVPELGEYDYVLKVDADIVMPEDYVELLVSQFEADPSLGIAGGHCRYPHGDGLMLEMVPEEHTRGSNKLYRRECLEKMLPLAEINGWDTADVFKARTRGWGSRCVAAASVIHQKPVSGGSGNVLKGRFVQGRGCHFLGYHPLYLVCRSVNNMVRPPYLLGGLWMLAGFAWAAMRGEATFEDAEVRRSLREWQVQRLRHVFRLGVRPPEAA